MACYVLQDNASTLKAQLDQQKNVVENLVSNTRVCIIFSQWLIVSNIKGVCLRSCVHVHVYSCCICLLLLRMIEANLSMSEWLDLKDPMLIAYSPKFQLGFNDNNHWIKSISWAILFKSSIFDALLRWFWSSNWGKFWAICNLCKCLLVHPPCASASWSGPTTWIGLLS